jgi:hypothetical protein
LTIRTDSPGIEIEVVAMSIFFVAGCILGSVVCFIGAFHHSFKAPSEELTSRRRRRLGALGLVFAACAVLLFVLVFEPGVVNDRIKEAEEITRQTFRDRIGREPDKIIFDNTNRKTAMQDGWQYAGSASLGDKTWDVTVTRDNYETPGKTTLRCEAKPRD